MKILIAYDSFNGCTEECAKIIQKHINGEVYLRKGEELKKLNIDEFDKIVIGSPIRFGKLAKSVKKFVKKNEDKLMLKDTYIFMCALSEENVTDYFNKLYGDRIINTAKDCSYFGGRIPVQTHSYMERMVEKDLRKNYDGKKQPNISRKQITHFCDSIEGREYEK